jgi:hypothetical protein
MKTTFVTIMLLVAGISPLQAQSQDSKKPASQHTHLYMDVHQLEPGKVKLEDVAEAHKKDLEVQSKFGVRFINYWVDEKNGKIYCLSSAPDSVAVNRTHAAAHGLMPEHIYEVTSGTETAGINPENLYLDIHYLGAGKVTAKDVSDAHQKDLTAEGKNGVRFINYWVDEKEGVVMCLSQASDSQDVIRTHQEAHGLIPAYIAPVTQGQ